MNQPDFAPGEQLVELGEHREAFHHFAAIANDETRDAVTRANARVWLGTLVRLEPALGVEDECGLSHYLRALALDPSNLGAMLGIVETYGYQVPDHQDVCSFRDAMHWLLRHKDGMRAEVRGEIERISARHRVDLAAAS